MPLSKTIAGCCLNWTGGRILQADNLEVFGIFKFPADFPAFAGHFPGKPVLPAIIQLAAVTYLAGLALGTDIRAQHYNRTKFRAMIQPEDEVQIVLRMDYNGFAWKGVFSLRKKTGEIITSGSVQY